MRTLTFSLIRWIGFTFGLFLGIEAHAALKVAVSIAPQAYLVKRIGGVQVETLTLVQPGDSEEAYQWTIDQRKQLSESQVYFYIHLPFESVLIDQLQKENEKRSHKIRIVDNCDGIEWLQMDGGCSCCHKESGAHAHFQDPHVWMSPMNMSLMAKTMAKVLMDLDPAFAPVYQKNLVALQEELAALHAELNAMLTPFKGRTMLVFHPSYGYFTKAYGLNQMAIEKDGKEPNPMEFKLLMEAIAKDQKELKAIFVQPNFSTEKAATLAKSCNLLLVSLDPLAEDYIAGMRQLAQKIVDTWVSP
jgi:zinc transport system substrate-binding protein